MPKIAIVQQAPVFLDKVRTIRNAVDSVREAARQYHTTIVRGMNEIDLNLVCTSKRALDIAGHYSRPDIFKLQVNNDRQSPIEFSK